MREGMIVNSLCWKRWNVYYFTCMRKTVIMTLTFLSQQRYLKHKEPLYMQGN